MNNLRLDDKQLEVVVNNIANDAPKKGDGLKFIGHLFALSGMLEPSFLGNSRDAYNKGRSDFGLEIRSLMLQHAFDKYVELEKRSINDGGQG